ncbi:MAG: rhomboid family intramembrane serine protease [Saprospiraceae bacterium]
MSIKYNSPVILTFALICTAVFFADKFLAGTLMGFFSVGTTVNWTDPISIFSLFSHVIGHGSMEHLLGNMTFVLLLGPIIEEKYGSRFTIMMIVATAFITGILNISFFSTGLLGASGIVFMLILLVSFTNVKGGQIPLTFILVALLFVGKEVIQSLGTDHVSQFAHIIGGVCGSIFGFVAKKEKKMVT